MLNRKELGNGKTFLQKINRGDLTWGGEHIVQHTDDVYRNVHLKPM